MQGSKQNVYCGWLFFDVGVGGMRLAFAWIWIGGLGREGGWQLATTELQTRCQSAVLCVRLLHPIQPILKNTFLLLLSHCTHQIRFICPYQKSHFPGSKSSTLIFCNWENKCNQEIKCAFWICILFWTPLFLMHILRSSILSYKAAS